MLGFAVIIGNDVLHPLQTKPDFKVSGILFLNTLCPLLSVKHGILGGTPPWSGRARRAFTARTGRSIMRAVQNQAQGRAVRVSRVMPVLLVSALNLRAAGIRLDDANDLRRIVRFSGEVSLF